MSYLVGNTVFIGLGIVGLSRGDNLLQKCKKNMRTMDCASKSLCIGLVQFHTLCTSNCIAQLPIPIKVGVCSCE